MVYSLPLIGWGGGSLRFSIALDSIEPLHVSPVVLGTRGAFAMLCYAIEGVVLRDGVSKSPLVSHCLLWGRDCSLRRLKPSGRFPTLWLRGPFLTRLHLCERIEHPDMCVCGGSASLWALAGKGVVLRKGGVWTLVPSLIGSSTLSRLVFYLGNGGSVLDRVVDEPA
jgi:hypothetical protein